ncbi:uncharacterized protein LOC111131117 [Crassostrea virginica]
MNSTVIAIILALSLSATLVVSSPIFPVVELSSMHPRDACLFICSICFHSKENSMLQCANNFCLSDYNFNGLGYLWIGKECAHWPSLKKFIAADNVLNS